MGYIRSEALPAFDRSGESENSTVITAFVSELDHDSATLRACYNCGVAIKLTGFLSVNCDAGFRIASPINDDWLRLNLPMDRWRKTKCQNGSNYPLHQNTPVSASSPCITYDGREINQMISYDTMHLAMTRGVHLN